MKSYEIQKKQNDPKLLKIQYAAHRYFDIAESLNHAAWIACLISAFSVFLPLTWSEYVKNGVPFIADIVAFILFFFVGHCIRTAATLRRYFDRYVLGMSIDQYTSQEIRDIMETAERIYTKNPVSASAWIEHTGFDTPSGGKDWYVFREPIDGVQAQFECQQQNTWWNIQMFRKRIIITVTVLILLVILFLLLMSRFDTLNILLCSAGIIIKVFERIFENIRYVRISSQISGTQKAVEVCPAEKNIEVLQNLIDARRTVNVLEFSFIHNKLAKMLSELYNNRITR